MENTDDERLERARGHAVVQQALEGATVGKIGQRICVGHARDGTMRRLGLPLAQIALDVGFYDQAAFSRTFARLTGQTPSQFRRAGRT
ncbi:MAG: helix-turn-helix domain-containing protein [Proteobacteria bacterium]|nr:helix-turn-helix domain-containing protein [Pseudomonadota bacterium]